MNSSSLLLLALAVAGGVSGSAMPTRADDGVLFAHAGWWDVKRSGSTCYAETSPGGGDHLAFVLHPKAAIIYKNDHFKIPAATYPIGMSYVHPADGMHREQTVNATIEPGRPDTLIIPFTSSDDLAALMSQGWLSLDLGGHMHFFNTRGVPAIRLLLVCEQGGHQDPFATAR